MSSIVEQVRGIFARRREQVVTTYADTVRRVAAGERIAPETAAATIEAAGRTDEQFASDVAHRQERVRLAILLAGRAAAERSRDNAVAAVQEIDRQAAAAAERFAEQAAPHRSAAAQAERAIAAADDAESRLLAGYAGPLRGELAAVESDMMRAGAEIADIRRLIAEAESHDSTVNASPSKYPDGERDRVRARLAGFRSRLAETIARHDELVRRRESDGFRKNEGLLVIATTNHPEKLDPAIVDRPSRFDRKYHFDLPAVAERAAYLGWWNRQLDDSLRLTDAGVASIAAAAEGFSFAYLKELALASTMAWMSRQETPMDEIMFSQVVSLREQMASIRPTVPAVV